MTESDRSIVDRTCRFRRIKSSGFRLVMEITYRCNLRCKHCFVPKAKAEPPGQQIIQVVQEAIRAGCRKVILTGGEPLLHPDLETIIRACAGSNVLVDLNSNLVGLTPERAERLREAGLGEVSASLHGNRITHDWLSGQDGCYDKTVQGIEMLLAWGIPVDVHSALWDESLDQIPSLVEVCQQLGIGSLTFFRILPSEHAPETSFPLSSETALARINDIRATSTIPIRTIGIGAPDFSECVMGRDILGVNADFELSACLLAKGCSLSIRGGEFEALRQQIQGASWCPDCV